MEVYGFVGWIASFVAAGGCAGTSLAWSHVIPWVADSAVRLLALQLCLGCGRGCLRAPCTQWVLRTTPTSETGSSAGPTPCRRSNPLREGADANVCRVSCRQWALILPTYLVVTVLCGYWAYERCGSSGDSGQTSNRLHASSLSRLPLCVWCLPCVAQPQHDGCATLDSTQNRFW